MSYLAFIFYTAYLYGNGNINFSIKVLKDGCLTATPLRALSRKIGKLRIKLAHYGRILKTLTIILNL